MTDESDNSPNGISAFDAFDAFGKVNGFGRGLLGIGYGDMAVIAAGHARVTAMSQ